MTPWTTKPADIIAKRNANLADEVAHDENTLREKANALREATSKLWVDLDTDDIVNRAIDLAEFVAKLKRKKAALDAARRMP